METPCCLPFLYAKIQTEVVTVRKGQKKRVWTPEQKPEIIIKHPEDQISLRTLEKEYNAERSSRLTKKGLLQNLKILQ